eukprot:418532-Alexandrium_andersonii.AAC.1
MPAGRRWGEARRGLRPRRTPTTPQKQGGPGNRERCKPEAPAHIPSSSPPVKIGPSLNIQPRSS